MDSFISLIFTFITKRASSFFDMSIMKVKKSIEEVVRDYLRYSILSSIAQEFFCLSTLVAFLEMAYQYDKTQLIRPTAVLVISLLVSTISLSFLSYFFQTKKFDLNIKAPDPVLKEGEQTLEQALSVLIIEFAKDREFSREQARKECNQHSEKNMAEDKV